MNGCCRTRLEATTEARGNLYGSSRLHRTVTIALMTALKKFETFESALNGGHPPRGISIVSAYWSLTVWPPAFALPQKN